MEVQVPYQHPFCSENSFLLYHWDTILWLSQVSTFKIRHGMLTSLRYSQASPTHKEQCIICLKRKMVLQNACVKAAAIGRVSDQNFWGREIITSSKGMGHNRKQCQGVFPLGPKAFGRPKVATWAATYWFLRALASWWDLIALRRSAQTNRLHNGSQSAQDTGQKLQKRGQHWLLKTVA